MLFFAETLPVVESTVTARLWIFLLSLYIYSISIQQKIILSIHWINRTLFKSRIWNFHVTNKNLLSIYWIITPRDGNSFLRWITGNHNSITQSQKLYFLFSLLIYGAVIQIPELCSAKVTAVAFLSASHCTLHYISLYPSQCYTQEDHNQLSLLYPLELSY